MGGPDDLSRRSARLFLFVILVVAAVLRLHGLDFGLPQPLTRPDEEIILLPTAGFFSGDLDPHFYGYPSLFFYLAFAAQWITCTVGRWTGSFESVEDYLGATILDPSAAILSVRAVAAISGVLAVWALYRLARAFGSRRAALSAAAILALSFGHIRQSHFGVTDVTADLWTILSLTGIVRSVDRRTKKHAVVTGLWIGLSTATKYFGAVLGPIALLTIVFGRSRANAETLAARVKRAAALAATAVAVFFLAMPWALTKPSEVWDGARLQATLLATGRTVDLGTGFSRHTTFSLPISLGWPHYVAGVAGVCLLTFTRGRRFWPALLFFVVYFELARRGKTVFLRYALPMLPLLAAGAGRFFESVVARFVRGRAAAAVVLATTVVFSWPSFGPAISQNLRFVRPDSRALAADWMQKNAEDGASFVVVAPQYAAPILPIERDRIAEGLATNFGKLDRAAVVRVIESRSNARGLRWYKKWDLDLERFAVSHRGAPQSTPPDFMITATSPLFPSDVPFDPTSIPNSPYRLAAEFLSDDGKSGIFDPQDAFYMPLRGFDGVRSPGPNIRIYRRK